MNVKYKDVNVGDILKADNGFLCLHENALRVVQKNDHGLFIECDEGQHYLDGQISFDDQETLVGLTKI